MADPRKGRFRARLEEAGPGLYRALYRGEINPDGPADDTLAQGPEILPDMHLGNDPEAVKLWVEQMARGMGYEHVEWESLPPRHTA